MAGESGSSNSCSIVKPVPSEQARTKIAVVEHHVQDDAPRWTDYSLSRAASGSLSTAIASPGQAGALKGSGGGKAQRGNISLSSRARSRKRSAPARKASTKAR